ncbi:MAG: amino acid permease [Candidatus Odinarchaeia archaeon]
MEKEPTLFVRKASGLTRVVSKWDALAYSFVAPTIGYAAHYIIWQQALYPQANVYISSLFILSLLPIAGLYVLFSASMPRSGGEYIYVSRIISPAWGFFTSWTLTIVGLNWSGVLTSWLINWGFGDTLLAQGIIAGDKVGNGGLVDLGLYLNNPGVGQSGVWAGTIEVFVIGTICLIFTYFVMSRGTKTVMRVVWIVAIWNLIGLITYAVTLLPAGPSVTLARLGPVTEQLTGTAYDWPTIRAMGAVAAAELGITGNPYTTLLLPSLMAGATYANLSTLGSTFSANIAGEIKDVAPAQILAQLGSLVLFVIYWEIFTFLQFAGFTQEYWQAVAYLNAIGRDVEVFGKLPLATFAVVFATTNPILVALSTLHFAVIDWGGMLTLAFGPVRNMFAWSFDGVVPYWINKVDRRGSPYTAVITGGTIAWIIFTINTFTPWLAYITHTIAIWMIGWCVLGIAGIIFPKRRRDIFEKSPNITKRRIAGIPLVSILGAITLGVAGWGAYSALLPAFTGEMSYLLGTVLFFVIIPFVIYYTFYFYRKKQGVPIDTRFKEIPPD